MDAVYPRAIDIGPNALELLISRLRQKLRPAGVNVRVLRGVGYRLEDASGDEDGSA
jgi:DNA-binding response OmpR family regulator